jgi:uncharacterized protein (DUF302 family)
MQTVTFRRDYRDRVSALTTVVYRAGATLPVADEVAEAARKAGALKE